MLLSNAKRILIAICVWDLTFLAAGDAADPVRCAAIGDFGTAREPGSAEDQTNNSRNEKAVADLVKSWKPDFIITLGDDNYPLGRQETTTISVNSTPSSLGTITANTNPRVSSPDFFLLSATTIGETVTNQSRASPIPITSNCPGTSATTSLSRDQCISSCSIATTASLTESQQNQSRRFGFKKD
jgi:hypothetical protein